MWTWSYNKTLGVSVMTRVLPLCGLTYVMCEINLMRTFWVWNKKSEVKHLNKDWLPKWEVRGRRVWLAPSETKISNRMRGPDFYNKHVLHWVVNIYETIFLLIFCSARDWRKMKIPGKCSASETFPRPWMYFFKLWRTAYLRILFYYCHCHSIGPNYIFILEEITEL